MGFERYYQVKILSKQLNFKKKLFYFSSKYQIPNTKYQLPNTTSSKLNPWFITGFVDGPDGWSFGITIYIDNRIKDRLVWAVKPSFQISLNSKDINLLLQLK